MVRERQALPNTATTKVRTAEPNSTAPPTSPLHPAAHDGSGELEPDAPPSTGSEGSVKLALMLCGTVVLLALPVLPVPAVVFALTTFVPTSDSEVKRETICASSAAALAKANTPARPLRVPMAHSGNVPRQSLADEERGHALTIGSMMPLIICYTAHASGAVKALLRRY